MVNLPGFQWVDNPRSDGGTYATDGPSCILLHQTVSMGISAGYIAGHPYPPQFWANPYTGERFQTISPDRSAFALYQADWGNSWTNKKGYTLQTEVVGVPVVNEATWTDAQCQWIGEQVVAPQAAWLASIGRPVDLNQVRYHTDSSGSASEYWPGRMGEAEWDSFNGLCAHIDCPYNDHWDCSVERLDLIAEYARAATGEEEFLSAEQYNDIVQRLARIEQTASNTNWQVGNVPVVAGNESKTIASHVNQILDLSTATRSSVARAEQAAANTNWQVGNVPAVAGNESKTIASHVNQILTQTASSSGPLDKAAVLRSASVDELLAVLQEKVAPAGNREATTVQAVDNEGNS